MIHFNLPFSVNPVVRKTGFVCLFLMAMPFFFRAGAQSCTKSVNFSGKTALLFDTAIANFPSSGQTTWFYTLDNKTNPYKNNLSHFLLKFGTCIDPHYSEAGTWTAYTNRTRRSGQFSLGQDGSTPGKPYGLKGPGVNNGDIYKFYFILDTVFGNSPIEVMIKPGTDFDSADVCGPSTTCGSSFTLPVKLLNFEGVVGDGGVVLTWTTATEINNSHFEVERSLDAVSWTKIGEVAGHGNSQVLHRYQFSDRCPVLLKAYYRLKQVDFDGAFEYSPLRVVGVRLTDDQVRVHPNPAKGDLKVTFASDQLQGEVNFVIMDFAGKVLNTIKTTAVVNEPLTAHINIENLENGIYQIQVSGENFNKCIQFIKNQN